MVPFAIALLWEDGTSPVPARIIATLIFAVASLTDFVDGYLARKEEPGTSFGRCRPDNRQIVDQHAQSA